jgi:hypothetical protein
MKTTPRKAVRVTSIHSVLTDPRVLRIERNDENWYSAVGVVQVLTESDHPEELWNDLKSREPRLKTLAEPMDFITHEDGQTQILDALNLDGVLRLVQSVPSEKAERLRQWLVESARQRLEEAEDPELALLRARRMYEQRGYSRRWIDKRLRSVAARHELTGEWFRRGAHDGQDYRTLTNELIHSAFGMDVKAYRAFKGMPGRQENLRDHMTDLELALTTLGETTAAVLHRDRDSLGITHLLTDVHDAGEIVSSTISDFERRTGKKVACTHLTLTPPKEQRQITRSVIPSKVA